MFYRPSECTQHNCVQSTHASGKPPSGFRGIIESMQPISRLAGALPGLLMVLALCIALIGMHHLISTGCVAGSNTHADAHVMDAKSHSGDVSTVIVSGADRGTSSGAGVVQPPTNAEHSDHLSAMCMAVLMLFSVIIPRARAIIVRRRPLSVGIRSASPPRSADPPDLRVLSISRT